MKLFLKFDFNEVCTKVLKQSLENLDIKYTILSFGEVEFLEPLSDEKINLFTEDLSSYGIEVVENHKAVLVQKIKDTIHEMVYVLKGNLAVKSSIFLAERLEHSYGYLSNLFSELTYTSIENYIIIQKIEYAKQLMLGADSNLTEIAFQLNYSSVAHLSTQFKNITGITPSAFQRIIKKRRELLIQNPK